MEKGAITLMAHLAGDAGGGVLGSGLIELPIACRRPFHGGGVHHELGLHLRGLIPHLEPVRSRRPVDLEGHRRWIIGPVIQRVHDVEIILDQQLVHDQRCHSASWIHLEAILVNRHRPEQVIIQARIEVVYLIAKVGGLRPHKEVDSNEGEQSLPVAAVPGDVFAGHEPHIGVENQRKILGVRNGTGPASQDVGRAENAIKVRNRR